ncbi:MAG: hypothetical protein WBH03_02615 [Cyclobacteriaceae bacterium]
MVQSPVPYWILRIAVTVSLAGQAYAHITGATPYRAVLYDQALMGWAVRLFGADWEGYINNPAADARLDVAIAALGVWLALAAISALFIATRRKWPAVLLISASLLLTLQAYAHYLDAGLQAAQLFEYSLQALSPLLLAGLFLWTSEKWWYFGLVLIAVTFAAHGLYALGFYPVPGHFIDMTMASTGLRRDTAEAVLLAAGTADLIVFVALFIPRVRKGALIYCIIWGLLTTAARYTTYVMAGSLFWLTFQQTLPLILVRIVHFGVPMAYYARRR